MSEVSVNQLYSLDGDLVWDNQRGLISPKIDLPTAAAPMATNRSMNFELTSDTSLTVYVRGSDGVTRSTVLNLT